MSAALASSIGIAASLVLFAGTGLLFVCLLLFLGRFLRPANPLPEKLEIYECGEPSIGSGFVQFDLRFYVVALVFIVLDVEVAFLFPWATVLGKSTHLADPRFRLVEAEGGELTDGARQLFRELGIRSPSGTRKLPGGRQRPDAGPAVSAIEAETSLRGGARHLALLAVADMLVFFSVLLVGFAYLWRRGDLDWVRAVPAPWAAYVADTEPTGPRAREPAASA